MTALEHVASTTPSVGEWQLIQDQARALASADIIPRDYRRKPANIVVAALTGRHFGWDVLTAMRNGHVIEGTWGMKPEAMLGLVRQAGHSVTAAIVDDGAQVTGRRIDNGDELTISFTFEDAKRAGLWNRGSWKTYPQVMCYWRAVGMLCRLLFSDITAGVHSSEELGASFNEDGDVVEAGDVAPARLTDAALEQFHQACNENGLDEAAVFERAFPDGVPDPLTDVHLPAMRDAFKALVHERRDDGDVVEAEVVEPVEASEDDPPATRRMVGKIKQEYGRMGLGDSRVTQLAITAKALGFAVASHNDLTTSQASKLIDFLVQQPDGPTEDE